MIGCFFLGTYVRRSWAAVAAAATTATTAAATAATAAADAADFVRFAFDGRQVDGTVSVRQ